MHDCSRQWPQTGLLLGTALPNELPHGKTLYNAAIFIAAGKTAFFQPKTLLPTYDVFDETRYFDPAGAIAMFPWKGERLGISICEDAWNAEERRDRRGFTRETR